MTVAGGAGEEETAEQSGKVRGVPHHQDSHKLQGAITILQADSHPLLLPHSTQHNYNYLSNPGDLLGTQKIFLSVLQERTQYPYKSCRGGRRAERGHISRKP